ncbi:MAG: hypothetical protein QOG53_1384 [Frankiales bacterium]|jgi:anionic cell wall polymer biosynthesis LytR-Cps2A-Psr (LCP) family protein|nr:hypothetical protein [Frankiales bacterium]
MGKRRRRRSLFPSREHTTAAPVRVGKRPGRYTPAEDAPAPVLTATTKTPTIAPEQPKLGRAERRRRQRKRQRRRRVSAVGVLAVVGGLIAAFVVFKVASNVGDNKTAPAGRTQTTLLMQIRAANGTAAASALLAHDTGTRQGVMLLVPSRVIAPIPGRGSAPFANALATGTPALSQAALSDLIGVTVDGGIVFNQPTFARLVDNLGGITADVDTEVVRRVKNGPAIVLVPRGSGQKLDGAGAVAYATYNGGGDIAQLPRVQQVIQGILDKVPDAASFTKALSDLGPGLQLNMSGPRVADLIAGLATDVRDNKVDIQSLDVKSVDVGGTTAFSIDTPEVKKFVQASLAASIPESLRSGDNRVLVKNGIGTPQLGTTTRPRLLKAHFVYIDGGNVPGFPFRTRNSAVLIFSGSQAARERGAQVAAALGLPASDVQISNIGQSVADVIVVLGRDYKR